MALKGIYMSGTDEGGYTGLSVEEASKLAKSRGVPFRVRIRDGQPVVGTADVRPGRINATVTDGIVVGYQIEGSTSALPPEAIRRDRLQPLNENGE